MKPAQTNKGFAPILIVIAVILLIPIAHLVNRQFIGVRYPWEPAPFYDGNNCPDESGNIKIVFGDCPSIMPLPTPFTVQPDETVYTDAGSADWKTYQGEDYLLKYPPDWTMVFPGDFINQDRGFSAHRESSAYLGNFANWCKFEPPCSGFVSPVQTKIINGFEAYQYTSTDEHVSKFPGITIYFPHNGRMYKVSWGVSPLGPSHYKFADLVKGLNDPIFDQILSTFKFLD